MLASLSQTNSPLDLSTQPSHILVIFPKLEKFPKNLMFPAKVYWRNYLLGGKCSYPIF